MTICNRSRRFTRSFVFPAALLLLWVHPKEVLADTEVRIATWNLQGVGKPGSKSYEAARAILTRIDADIVAINEVAGTQEVKYFKQLAKAAGFPYFYLPDTKTIGFLCNAFLSKFPITQGIVHTAVSLSGDPKAKDLTRPILEITVDLPGNERDLTLIVEHWKSETGIENEFRRACESLRIAQILAKRNSANDAFVVMGDMNEEADAMPRSPKTFYYPPKDLSTSFRLGTDLKARMKSKGIPNNPFAILAERSLSPLPALQLDGKDATRPQSGRRLDYILVSSALRGSPPSAEVYDSQDESIGGGLPKVGLALPYGPNAWSSLSVSGAPLPEMNRAS